MRSIFEWTFRDGCLPLGTRTAIMGILNTTPDSFSDGGRFADKAQAVDRALQIEAEGADILDIGGESSRPGSAAVTEDEELRRVLPVVEALDGRLRIPISIDTYRARVAREALDAGARIVNDISAFRFEPSLAEVVRDSGAGVVLMHSRGARSELHIQTPMTDPVGAVVRDLHHSLGRAIAAGIPRSAIVVDPGIGFGKRAEESLEVLRNLGGVAQLECPLLVGSSRKSFLRRLMEPRDFNAREALWATAATVARSVVEGAHIVRVHDVQEMRLLTDVLDATARQ